MARVAREKSRTGVYHVMLRGINRQTIFECDQDKIRFLDTLGEYKEICQYKLYGYCLMDNHIHLLIKEAGESISDIIKRVCSSYVYWYNAKYKRCGHLFQDRFKSEVVETYGYLLTVLRYIHQNPIKANMTKAIDGYKWTSYKEYFGMTRLIDIDLVLNYFSEEPSKAKVSFAQFMKQDNDDRCLDVMDRIKLTDDEVRVHIRGLGFPNSTIIQQLDKNKRDHVLGQLKDIEGVSIRQLARITGISRSVIERI